MSKEIPYKIYLEENEMPKAWYNLRADMINKPAPLLNPGTLQPMKAEELAGVFCEELVKQELDNDTRFIEIPEEIRNFYKMYRPSPLVELTALKRSFRHLLRFTTNSRVTIHQEATNLTQLLLRLTTLRNRALRALPQRPVLVSGVQLFQWLAHISILTAKYSWLRFLTNRSLSDVK